MVRTLSRLPLGEPFDHLGGGPPVVGEGGEDLLLYPPVLDQMTDAGGEHPGLPRPGRGDDPGRADQVGHRLVLVRRQFDRGLDEGRDGGIQAQVYRLVVYHRLMEIERLTGTTVNPYRGPIGSGDIGRATDGDIETGGRLVTPPPHQPIGAGVVGVVPDRLGESFPEKGESASQLVGGGVSDLGPAQLVGCGGELVYGRCPIHVAALGVVHRGCQIDPGRPAVPRRSGSDRRRTRPREQAIRVPPPPTDQEGLDPVSSLVRDYGRRATDSTRSRRPQLRTRARPFLPRCRGRSS